MLVQINIPKELHHKLRIYQAQEDLRNIRLAVNKILQEKLIKEVQNGQLDN